MSVANDLISLGCLQIADYLEKRQKSGANFNVFNILKRTTDEVNGHSSFIAELLNPSGSHGMEDVFLKSFFETLGISENVKGFSHWKVLVEAGKDVDGRMDILIVGRDSGRNIRIAIENKINATDQPRQLQRYLDFLEDKFDTSCYLYYLTLDGKPPTDQSLGNIPKSKLQWVDDNIDAPVRLLSYSVDILEWLKICHEKLLLYPYARETTSQYIDTVNSLTGNGGGMVDELKNLLNTPDKLFTAAMFSNAVTKVKQELLISIWDLIKIEWKKRVNNEDLLKGDLKANKHAKSDESMIVLKSKGYFVNQKEVRHFGFASEMKFFEDTVRLEIRFKDNFRVGLYGVGEEDNVLDKSVVEKFYCNFKHKLPHDCYLASIDKSQKQKIAVQTGVKFNTDNKEMFDLFEQKNKEKFVVDIINLAEEIVRELQKLDFGPNKPTASSGYLEP